MCRWASSTRVRDAFAELLKELAAEELRACVAHSIVVAVAFGVVPSVARWDAWPATGAVECADPSLLARALARSHDGAAVRLRTHLDERLTQAPSKSRGIKVQQHVLTWRIGDAAREAPSKREAMVDTTVVTLATSLDRAQRQPAAAVARELPMGVDVWMTLVVEGDGVAANGRVGRIL